LNGIKLQNLLEINKKSPSFANENKEDNFSMMKEKPWSYRGGFEEL
jgi:hypothetical protein